MFKLNQRVMWKYTGAIGTIEEIVPHKDSFYALVRFDIKPDHVAINPAPIHFDGLAPICTNCEFPKKPGYLCQECGFWDPKDLELNEELKKDIDVRRENRD